MYMIKYFNLCDHIDYNNMSYYTIMTEVSEKECLNQEFIKQINKTRNEIDKLERLFKKMVGEDEEETLIATNMRNGKLSIDQFDLDSLPINSVSVYTGLLDGRRDKDDYDFMYKYVEHFVGKVDGVYMDIAPVDGVRLKKDFKGRFKFIDDISWMGKDKAIKYIMETSKPPNEHNKIMFIMSNVDRSCRDLDKLALECRDRDITCLFADPFAMINRDMRLLVDYAFMEFDDDVSNKKRLFDRYCNMFRHYSLFDNTFKQICTEDGLLVVHRSKKTHDLSKKVFWYRKRRQGDEE